MINRVELKNFGSIEQINWQELSKINLIIGNNGCGKSFLLKALYSAIRTLEEYKRGDNPDSLAEILASNLYWTFQPEKIGDLVLHRSSKTIDLFDELSLHLELDENCSFRYAFDSHTGKSITNINNNIANRPSNSIFLPAKEVLSLHHIILKSREQDKLFGFDNTYLDLAKALQIPPTLLSNNSNSEKGHSSGDFNDSRKKLEEIIGGKVEFDEAKKRWYFKKGNQRFPMGITAEGIKKIAILDYLLGNRYLSENSIIFIDEPESALHPQAISQLLDIVAILANHGIQFFIASHSYFVIKKLFLIAQEKSLSIPVLSYQNEDWQQSDLKDDLPDNPIIDESIRLYKQEIGL